jgi:hypothetical protein
MYHRIYFSAPLKKVNFLVKKDLLKWNRMDSIYQEKEGSTDEFFSFVFSRSEPKPKKSIHFQYITDGPIAQTRQEKEEHWKDVFDFLVTIFTKAMQHFYRNEQNQVNLDQLTQKQMDRVKSYFESFGVTFTIEIYPNKKSFELTKQPETIDKEDEPSLTDYFLNFQTKERYYHLSFSLL